MAHRNSDPRLLNFQHFLLRFQFLLTDPLLLNLCLRQHNLIKLVLSKRLILNLNIRNPHNLNLSFLSWLYIDKQDLISIRAHFFDLLAYICSLALDYLLADLLSAVKGLVVATFAFFVDGAMAED